MMSSKVIIIFSFQVLLAFGLQKPASFVDAKSNSEMEQYLKTYLASLGKKVANQSAFERHIADLRGNRSSRHYQSLMDSVENATFVMFDFSEAGYQAIVSMRRNGKMGQYVRKYLSSKGKMVSNYSAFKHFLPEFSGMRNSHNFSSLVAALENATFVAQDLSKTTQTMPVLDNQEMFSTALHAAQKLANMPVTTLRSVARVGAAIDQDPAEAHDGSHVDVLLNESELVEEDQELAQEDNELVEEYDKLAHEDDGPLGDFLSELDALAKKLDTGVPPAE
eukprot:TRINITY_DN32087_c0_g1_i1.p1 TRINITY_DN32087_c0_g1~~TRINITY_DN32087_c0_g1_i1.p1  ORF type:complete len:294 (+),score=47.11 TRINITY_DN32087_c0_g1_i1:49-882(+)